MSEDAPSPTPPSPADGEQPSPTPTPAPAATTASPAPSPAAPAVPPALPEQTSEAGESPATEEPAGPDPTPGPWQLAKAGASILRNPLEATPRLADELAPSSAGLLGVACCVVMAVTYPLYRPGREDVIDGLVRYGFDVLIAAAGLAAFALTLHLLRRFAFEQQEAHPAHSLFLVGCFALITAAAATAAWILELLRLGFLAPLLLGAGKVMGLCALYSALSVVAGLEKRGTLIAISFSAGIANLIFALEMGMGRLF